MSRDFAAIVEELATGKKEGRPNYKGEASRRLEASVKLGDGEDGKSTIHLELSVSHYKEGKAFSVTAHIEARENPDGSAFAVSRWEPMNRAHNLRFQSVPCPRYSAKALEAAWESTIATLRQDPSVLDRLDLNTKQVA